MTTPAQQFTADYDAKMAELAKLQAKVQTHAEAVAAHDAELSGVWHAIEAIRDELAAINPSEPPPTPEPEPEPTPEPEPEPEPTPPPSGLVIVPGPGWTGETPTPPQVGNVTETVIARWNVVPEQSIENGFTVGVVAHHLDGIDRVEIAANGGDWAKATLGINPRTRCEEYFASLATESFIGDRVQLRAIAYPIVGQPVVLPTITLHTSEVGEVLELDAGEHTLNPRDLPETGWLTVRPKPGVNREDVVLVGKSRFWKAGRLKLENLTIQLAEGGGSIMGGAGLDNHVWLDRCRIIGAGPSGNTWAIVYCWRSAAITDCEISDLQRTFHGAKGINYLVRNTTVSDLYEDLIGANGLYANITVENLDRQPVIDAGEPKPHPDILQVRILRNTILQDVTATNNVNAQGIFVQANGGKPGLIDGAAFVRINIDVPTPWKVFGPEVPISNLLIKGSVLGGGVGVSQATLAGRFVSTGNTKPDGSAWVVDLDGVEVQP